MTRAEGIFYYLSGDGTNTASITRVMGSSPYPKAALAIMTPIPHENMR